VIDPADGKPVKAPWLAPDAACLATLARGVGPVWPLVRHDPGLVLLLLRFEAFSPARDFESLCAGPLPLSFTLRMLRQAPVGLPDLYAPRALERRALAAICERLAEVASHPHPGRAWCVGLLAQIPGIRFLCQRWGLPRWLAEVVGNLDLSSRDTGGIVADQRLFALTRLAIARVRRIAPDVADEEAAGLRLDGIDFPPPTTRAHWSDPYSQPLLRPLLEVAIENRRLLATSQVENLEREIAHLHAALGRRAEGEAEALRLAKLSALAEFAAGAGHEINNPLAVISGQAQYVLSHKEDWLASDEEESSHEALGKIIAQTKRIHGILRELMQFARPPAPRYATVDLVALMREVAVSHNVSFDPPNGAIDVRVDAEQMKTALGCLVRNALEAIPPGGWVRLTVQVGARVEVHVEDSGPGPRPEQVPHLFDPFYCGRSAGRGKGFGLPVAWRLARQQGGDVVYVARPGQPTRFTLSLPRAEAATMAA
jgi:signal transduction histidine kinase